MDAQCWSIGASTTRKKNTLSDMSKHEQNRDSKQVEYVTVLYFDITQRAETEGTIPQCTSALNVNRDSERLGRFYGYR